MSTPVFSLGVVHVPQPCPVSWESMDGTDRVRFCSQCRQNVYNLSEMTRPEAEHLIAETEGKVCLRFYRRTDGRIMTRDCRAVRWARSVRRRVAVVLGGAFTVFLLFATWVYASTRPSDGSDRRARRSGIRDAEPFKTVLDWIDPPTRVTMGVPCYVRPDPIDQPEVAPPPRPVERSSPSEG
jgi:hypothetical protein